MKPSDIKILLVDDSEVMLGLVATLLKKQGLAVVTATNMTTALEAYLRQTPTVILMDFVLEPTRTGLEALAAIFAVCNTARPLAAILTQGALSPQDKQKASDWKVEVLQKPTRGKEAEFLASINDWLARNLKPVSA